MKKQQIFLDMDGVLVDFLSGAMEVLNRKYGHKSTIEQYATYFGEWDVCAFYGITGEKFWDSIHSTPNFWYNLKPMPWAKRLYEMLKELGDVTIVTTPSDDPDCSRQKLQWLSKHLGIKPDAVLMGSRKYLLAGNGLLIDDYSKNVYAFKAAGGDAILIPSNWNTLDLTFEEIQNIIINKDNMSQFEIKDSGERKEFESGMLRDTNASKARPDLCYPIGLPYKEQMLTRFAEHMASGAQKYSSRNWEKANGDAELERFKESAFRHFTQWFCGEKDEDHASAVFFNIMAWESIKYKVANDNSKA